MIVLRRLQPSFGDSFIAEEVGDLWEPWMRHADRLLEDETLVTSVHQELSKRFQKSKRRGRPGTSAEVALRMLLLKHMRDFSFEDLTREVRCNLVYREFTRVGAGKVPDDKTMGRLARQLGPGLVKQLHERVVEIAQEEKIVQGQKLRVDTTVVETDIHYPTDSGLLGDGVRVLTRLMKKIEGIAGGTGMRLRDRTRTVKLRVIEIARSVRSKGTQAQEKLQRGYVRLLASTERVVGQAKRFVREIESGIKRTDDPSKAAVLAGLKDKLSVMTGRVDRIVLQTKARILGGNVHFDGKVFSLFEYGTEAIRKGKAAKPTEFGKMVKIQEAEAQVIVDYEVFAKRPNDADLLLGSIETHVRLLGRVPRLVAADAAFYSSKNEKAARQKGVKRFCVPNRSTKNPELRREQKKRSFRKGQKWRVGCEGRISVLKRRHGLIRSRYKGAEGIQRWVGFGVIADNLISMGSEIAAREKKNFNSK